MENIVNNTPLVLVVIPTYKRSERVGNAINSVLKQTYNNIKIVVVDDNGENTQEQLKTYNALKDFIINKQITYIINKENVKGSKSRNNGLFSCESDYCTFLDDDDELYPTKIEKQVQLLEKLGQQYSCCYSGYDKILENGKVYHSSEKCSGNCYGYALSRSIYVGSGSNLLVRSNIAKKIGGYDISFKKNQDIEFLARLLKNYKLAYIDESLFCVHYEIRETKLTYEMLLQAEQHFVNYFKEEINNLGKYKAKRIYRIIALERFRMCLGKGHSFSSFINCIKNKCGIITFTRYFIYLIDRIIFKKSYGFKLF